MPTYLVRARDIYLVTADSPEDVYEVPRSEWVIEETNVEVITEAAP